MTANGEPTPFAKLPQFVDDDRPSFTDDINHALYAVDRRLYDQNAISEDNSAKIESIKGNLSNKINAVKNNNPVEYVLPANQQSRNFILELWSGDNEDVLNINNDNITTVLENKNNIAIKSSGIYCAFITMIINDVQGKDGVTYSIYLRHQEKINEPPYVYQTVQRYKENFTPTKHNGSLSGAMSGTQTIHVGPFPFISSNDARLEAVMRTVFGFEDSEIKLQVISSQMTVIKVSE